MYGNSSEWLNSIDSIKLKGRNKFKDQRSKRKASSNGHSLKRRQFWHDADDFRIIKHSKFDVITPFETQFLKRHLKSEVSYTISQNEFNHIMEISKISELNSSANNAAAKYLYNIDDIFSVSGNNETHPFENCLNYRSDRLYLCYYKGDLYEKDYQRFVELNSNSNSKMKDKFNLDEIPKEMYIKDSHYTSFMFKLKQKNSNYSNDCWLNRQLEKPSKRIKCDKMFNFEVIPSGKCFEDCNFKRCYINEFNERSYWRPKDRNNMNDCVTLKLKDNCYIEGISTRGKPLKRNPKKNYELIDTVNNVEFVKRYKLFIAKEANSELGVESLKWEYLGKFGGNKDSETEVFHFLSRPNILYNCNNSINERGVIAKYIKIVPVNNCFEGNKSMRFGVYGRNIYDVSNPSFVQKFLKQNNICINCENKSDNINEININLNRRNVNAKMNFMSNPSNNCVAFEIIHSNSNDNWRRWYTPYCYRKRERSDERRARKNRKLKLQAQLDSNKYKKVLCVENNFEEFNLQQLRVTF